MRKLLLCGKCRIRTYRGEGTIYIFLKTGAQLCPILSGVKVITPRERENSGASTNTHVLLLIPEVCMSYIWAWLICLRSHRAEIKVSAAHAIASKAGDPRPSSLAVTRTQFLVVVGGMLLLSCWI